MVKVGFSWGRLPKYETFQGGLEIRNIGESESEHTVLHVLKI